MGDPARLPQRFSGEPNPGKRCGNHQHYQGNGGNMTLHPAPPRRPRATIHAISAFYENGEPVLCQGAALRFAEMCEQSEI